MAIVVEEGIYASVGAVHTELAEHVGDVGAGDCASIGAVENREGFAHREEMLRGKAGERVGGYACVAGSVIWSHRWRK